MRSPTAVAALLIGALAAAGAAAADLQTVTLDEVLAAARAASPGLRLAQVTVDSARAQKQQAQAASGLSLAGKAGYVHAGSLQAGASSTAAAAAAAGASGQALSGDNAQAGLTLSGPATSVGLTLQQSIAQAAAGDQVTGIGISLSQSVFDGYPGGRAAAASAQADYTFQAAQVAYDASVKSLVYQATLDYYTLLGDQAAARIRQATVAQAEQNLASYQGLLAVGRATQLDVLQSQVTLTQAQLDLRSAQNTVETDRRNLSAAVGWPLDRAYAAASAPAPQAPQLTLDQALTTAFKNRSELRTLALNTAAAGVALRLQQAQAWPVVSIDGSLGAGQDWSAGVSTGSFTVGASISLPVADGGLRAAQVQQARDQAAAYAVQQDQQTASISIAVAGALFGVGDARDRLALAAQAVTAAQGQYDLQKARYAAGLVTTLDVLTAFSSLTTAQVGLEQARSAYALAILGLNNSMGL